MKWTYNADGLRVQVASPSETLNKIWDFQTMIAEAEGTNAIPRYAHKPGLYGDVLHQWGQDPSRFYLSDALGSTIGLTDDSQDVSDSYLYKAYGEVLASSGSTVNPFQWVGRFGYQYDKITNDILQQYIRQRHYLPTTAAWLSQDPLGLSLFDPNLYQYVLNHPTRRIDPSGLQLFGIPGLAGCLAGAGISIGSGIIFGRDDNWKQTVCKAIVACIAGAIAEILITISPANAKCIIAAAASLGGFGGNALCDAIFAECDLEDVGCALAAGLWVTLVGCLTSGLFSQEKLTRILEHLLATFNKIFYGYNVRVACGLF